MLEWSSCSPVCQVARCGRRKVDGQERDGCLQQKTWEKKKRIVKSLFSKSDWVFRNFPHVPPSFRYAGIGRNRRIFWNFWQFEVQSPACVCAWCVWGEACLLIYYNCFELNLTLFWGRESQERTESLRAWAIYVGILKYIVWWYWCLSTLQHPINVNKIHRAACCQMSVAGVPVAVHFLTKCV